MTLILLSEEQQRLLHDRAEGPVYVVDEASRARYVLVPEEVFRRVEAVLADEGADPRAWLPLTVEALAADLDAPGMELYDDYDAHRLPT